MSDRRPSSSFCSGREEGRGIVVVVVVVALASHSVASNRRANLARRGSADRALVGLMIGAVALRFLGVASLSLSTIASM